MLPSPVPSPHAPRALRRRMAALVRTQADHLTAPYQQGHLGGGVALLRTGSASIFLSRRTKNSCKCVCSEALIDTI